ncbi:MAG: TetR/AcrR family transcriptional regulator [Xanthomonadaceae bacterium]|nr:TetR/AcrR family transcriptional regulator [Xanthomonadaceae bacterium]
MTATRKKNPGGRGRGVGRPRAGKANVREGLIDAAIAEFIRTGIRATSLRVVAEAAGVTPAMLHYYFGDKRQLILAVVEERLLPALAPMRAGIEAGGSNPVELANLFVNGVGGMVAAHPWLPPLWIREVLCEGGALREHMFKRAIPQLPQLLAQRFAAAQAQGRLAPDLDPRLMVVSLVGLTLFPAAGAPIWRQMFDAGDLDDDALRRHTLALLGHGMGARWPGRSKARRKPE